MPRGKDLEQLPMANTLPGMGQDRSKMDREVLGTITTSERPEPAKAGNSRKPS
jgi:hypothetical protein